MILEKLEDAWCSKGFITHPPSPSFLPQAQRGFASFVHLVPSPERHTQASHGETVKGTETRSVLVDQTVERLPPERIRGGYEGHTREEGVKARHPGKQDVSYDIVPRSNPCLTT